VRLGNSGLKVSKIILGTMQYGTSEWQDWVLGEEEAIIHIKTVHDAGINTFDTADTYSNGLSEVVLGNAIKRLRLPRDEIVVMTKARPLIVVGRTLSERLSKPGVHPDQLGCVNPRCLSRKHIFTSIKKSLEHFQLDYVDLLSCNRFDTETLIEETMQALHDVVQCPVYWHVFMLGLPIYALTSILSYYAITNHRTPFISMQSHHNLIYREEEREMFPTLKMFGVGCIP
ncbi:NADP-dependent oxidoreductase domain-containing protein, partial [Suillus americanus]